MRPFLFLLVFLSAPLMAASAQTVTILRETPLYERPSFESEEKAVLPGGLQLTLVQREGEWLIVSTSEGLVGWIPRTVAHVRDENPPPSNNPPPQAERPPQNPPRQEAEPIVPRRSQPSAQVGTRSQGFYNHRRWSRLEYGNTDNVHLLTLAGGTMWGRSLEAGTSVTGARLDVVPEDYWFTLEVGGHVNVFLIQPRGGNPFGAYVGGRLGWTQYFLGENNPTDISSLRWGGEGGAYLHLGSGSALIVPFAAIRIEDFMFLNDEFQGLGDPEPFTSVLLGTDFVLRGFVPGIAVMLQEDTTTLLLRLTFAWE